jgi:phage baseplate assembly protein W
MAIKINVLEEASNGLIDKQYVYKDITLDLAFKNNTVPGFTTPIFGNDINASYDLNAITNSLVNLFNTLPGQRFLFPKYGLDLNQFLFSPITVDTGDLIGNLIYNSILRFEPRVIPRSVRVLGDPENNEYRITIVIELPIFNNTTDLNFTLNTRNRSFVFLQTTPTRKQY